MINRLLDRALDRLEAALGSEGDLWMLVGAGLAMLLIIVAAAVLI